MRAVVFVLLALPLGAGAVLAQPAPTPAARPAAAPAAKAPAAKDSLADAMAECMRLWDAGTHMTRQEWARTCRRIQTRLDNLKIENLNVDATTPKAGRKKRGS